MRAKESEQNTRRVIFLGENEMTEFEKNLAVLEKSYEKGRLFEINYEQGTWECDGIDKKGKMFLMRRKDFVEEVKLLHKLRFLIRPSNGSMDYFWDLKRLSLHIPVWTRFPRDVPKNLIMDFSFLEKNTLHLVYDLRDIDEQKNQTN